MPLLIAVLLVLAVLLVMIGCWLLCVGAGRVSRTAFDEDRRGDGRQRAAGTNDQRS